MVRIYPTITLLYLLFMLFYVIKFLFLFIIFLLKLKFLNVFGLPYQTSLTRISIEIYFSIFDLEKSKINVPAGSLF